MSCKSCNCFNGGNALFFGLVCEHRAADAITNCINGRHGSLEMRINLDSSELICLDTHVFQTEAFGVGAPSGRDQHNIVFLFLDVPTLRWLGGEDDTIVFNYTLYDLSFQVELKALLLEGGLELFTNFVVVTGQNAIQEFDNRNVCSQSSPDRSHLETDDSASDYCHLLRNFSDFQCSGAIDDLSPFVVDWNGRQRCHFRPGGDENVLRIQAFAASLVESNLYSVGTRNFSFSFVIVYAVLLEQVLNSAGQSFDRLRLGVLHFVDIHGNVPVNNHSVIGEMVLCVVVVVCRCQKRLGWDATNVQTGSTQSASHLDAGCFHSKLGRFDGSDVSARTTTDYDEIILVCKGCRCV
mmetsp:Transcript_12005/g.34404  ORF Transcript_12005/g.34404 Transcript_12005/m.34404 type:complete len:352 (-) Transcript_12005:264-1319(-)